jgi:acyl transferase domain-containing protein/NADPH:quinone reductase-like Zn-dependent oxidoreductase/acyl carrier protein
MPIAVVGASCRLPGAPDLAGFARLLAEGRDAVSEVPHDRFDHARYLHPRPGEPGRAVHFRAGTIGDVRGFDAAAFGISPREAAEMDPQQRLLLTLARGALADAGWPESRLAGENIGAYVGASTTDWSELRQQDQDGVDRYAMTGGALSILSNRLGHVFDLRGPALTVDTACSSAMVALHEACEAMRHGRIPAALVAGVNLLLSPFPFGGFWRAGMLGLRGRCQAFGAGADGYVRAEGGVVLVLKPLDAALRDGDAVRGVIRATGVNGAGRTRGISLPDGDAQAALIRAVLHAGRVKPDALGYFEAHGTGTPAGDPIEAGAIHRGVGRRRLPLPIGSSKSNIGHTEAASGLAGVLKAMLVLEDGRIPPTLHAEVPNPAIPFGEWGLQPATRALPLLGEAVAVNSFGFGGTNGCAVLVGAPRAAGLAPAAKRAAPPLLLSARSAEGLRALAGAWRGLPAARIAPLARAQAAHRDLLPHRLVVRGPRFGALLAEWLADGRGGTGGVAAPGEGVVFVFSGNGAQWPGMGADEMRASPAFRRAVSEADAALQPTLGWSVRRRLARGASAADLARTDVAQPLLFAMQLGIAAALAEQGIVPRAVIGHSVGEAAAAQLAGLLSPAGAARLIAARSRQQHRTRGIGRMAALGTSAALAGPVLELCGPGLEIAAVNAPEALTIAGPPDALERLALAARERRWSFVALDLDYSFHSAAMEPVRAPLLAELRGLRGRPGRIPMFSTVTGEALEDCPPAYWWRNLREPVRFAAAVGAALDLRPALFLEIGPNPVLQGYLRAILRDAGREAAVLPSLRRAEARGGTGAEARGDATALDGAGVGTGERSGPGGGPDRHGVAQVAQPLDGAAGRRGAARPADPFPLIADRATAAGADPRGAPGFGPVPPGLWRALPAEPALSAPLWFPRGHAGALPTDTGAAGPLLGVPEGEGGEEWRGALDTLLAPWLADHALGGVAVLPAAAMAEIALEAAAGRFPAAAALELRDFSILRPVPLGPEAARELRARMDAAGGFTLESRRRLADEGWTLHATGRAAALPAMPVPPEEAVAGEWRDGADLTAAAARLGLAYGPAFRPVARWRLDGARVAAELALPATAPPEDGFVLHPVRLDGALQALLGLLAESGGADGFVPVRFGRLVARRGGAAAVAATMELLDPGQRRATARGVLCDALGQAVAVLEAAEFQRLPRGARADAALAFRTDWVPAPLPAAWPGPPPPLDIRTPEAPGAEPGLDEAALLLAAQIAAAAGEAGLAGAQGPLAEALRRALPALDALPEAGAIWQQVLEEQPGLAHELAALAEAAEALPTALLGLPAPPARLAPEAATLRRLAAALAEAAGTILRGWPADRPCRVLVAAAEDGPLLPALRAALAPLGAALRLSVAPLPGDRAPPVPPGAALAPWDPSGEAPPPGEADLVLGLALSPRLGAGSKLLEGLRRAVAPSGVLLLAEPLPDLFWDATEGLDPTWWDAPRLCDGAGWQALLAEGWAARRVLPLPPLPWPAALVLAQVQAGALLLPAAPSRRFALWHASAMQPWAAALAEELAHSGASVVMLPPDPAPKALRGVQLLAFPGAEDLAALARLAAAAEGVAEGLHLVVRDGAQDPSAAAALALGRVLLNEMPRLAPRRHDLHPALSPLEAARRLAAALLTPPDAEAEQRLSAEGRRVPRLLAGLPAAAPSGPLRLEAAVPGQLGSLEWQAAPALLDPPGPGAVRLRVEAAGLNFRDVMWAQGLLPEETLRPGFAGPGLGMEVAGTVEAVGEGVALRVGERVFGVAPRGLATRASTAAAALARLPDGLAMADAAALPVAFLTAIHALEELARLGPGERVLIHGGAGAVGLAALQVALAAGARVAVTAGSPGRRAFLRAAGAELALDSRDGGFADALRVEWDGVDVCLNSLSGEAMERSLGLMAPFGRFLELGKRDYAEATRVALRPLRRNVSYFAVDVDELARARPAIAARHLATLAARLERGELRPLPVQTHRDAEDAFRRLQSGGHVGKLVILPPAERAPAAPAWAPGGTAVVVGGAAGFGLEAAYWLAGQGVRHLALLSRRGAATPGAEAARARLLALGAEARFLAVDAADGAALASALDDVRRTMPPIEAVLHAAAVFSDGIAARLEQGAVEAVWRAKVLAAEHLDRLTADDPLRLFLLFSSATVPIGSPGQASYVAANAGLEAIARRRHAGGRPALAVQWGPIADAGALAADGAAALSHRLGATALPAAEALAALPELLAAGLPVAGLARLDWQGARRALPLLAEAPFAALAGAAEAAAEDGAGLRDAIAAAAPEAALELLRLQVGREVGRILRLPPGAVPAHTPLPQLGLDSLGGIELRTGLERRFSVEVPLESVSEGLTVDGLARRLLASLSGLREAAE